MSLIELSDEEKKEIAEHIVAPRYTRKVYADMNWNILHKLGFKAEVKKAAEYEGLEETEWIITYEGQEGGAE